MRGLGERGFTMLEVLVTITILGVLATIAIPRFNSARAQANTAKIQADLQTLDSAIVMYEMEQGKSPAKLSDLEEYVKDLSALKPPQGKCFLANEKEVVVDDDSYTIAHMSLSGGHGEWRALCEGKTAGEYGR